MNINSSLQKTPIAVVGLSAIFADAKNIEEYWTNIIQGKDSIKEVPDSRWSIDDYYDPDMRAPDKTYCKVGGFLPEIDFNPMEFGLPPNILEVTDASQLLGLVAARDALEDAGYGKNSAKFTAELKAKTGVLLGVGGGQKLITPLIARLQYPIWEKALRASGIAEADIPHIVDKMKKAYVGWNENSFPGLLGNVISGRITNRFDLGGINSVVDAACAASLSAIKMSLSELVEGRCDMMLTGGVDTDNSPFMYMSFSKTPAFSKSGKISPFSDAADGMLIGEGIGMLVLKRLVDAERDGDRIYAVVKGVGTSSDGRFKSVYAPRSSGQALAMERAYEDAGYAAHTVGLLEAHGTGTGAGDPTEFESMRMVFSANNTKKQHIALGSVKSQIGHTKAAAGAAGMVKAVLGLHHKVLPPTINVDQPNSKFNIKETPIYINTEARPWIRNGIPRRAGVSAFGFGGINVHLALEEYTGKSEEAYRLHQPYKEVILQGNSPEALRSICKELIGQLKGAEAENVFNQICIDSNAAVIAPPQARLGFVTQSVAECIELLEESYRILENNQPYWDHPKGIHYRNQALDMANHKVVALFSGQGSQYIGMGKESANAFPTIANCFEQADKLFYAKGEPPLSNTVYPIPTFAKEEKVIQVRNLTRTENAQPAIGMLSMGQYKVLANAGFKADMTSGHSFGELTALWAAGVYDDTTFMNLAKNRGAAMAIQNPNADSGSMLAVKESEAKVAAGIQNIPGVQIANINAKNQVILGGSTDAILSAEKTLSAQGFSCVKLPVSAAFHTPFVKHAQAPFSSFVDSQSFQMPKIPVYANTTGAAYPNNQNEIKDILKNQILNPVQFKKQIENLYAAGGRIFVEFGPKGVLTNLVKNILSDKGHRAIAINPNSKKDSDLQLRQAAVQLRVTGLSLSNVDPYKRNFGATPALSKMNVKLSGNNYVSAATQKAYTDVLNNDFKISNISSKQQSNIASNGTTHTVAPVTQNTAQNEEEMLNREALNLLKEAIESFKGNQNKSLEIFERFMNEQNQHSNQLLQILSQAIEGSNGNVNIVQQQSTQQVNQVTAATMYSNGSSQSNGNGHSNGSSNGANHGVSKPVISNPVPTPPASPVNTNTGGGNSSQLEKILLEVVSEKTGYPAEMLELNMDMEADLGIDSIKRVEIFGALTSQYPEMSDIDPNELTELRTLGEIVTFVSGKGGAAVAAKATTPVQQVANTAVSAPVTASTSNGATSSNGRDNSALTKILLEVVSEKTGYPAEMLELNMDMEADLGIDSIKRVEIFGALTAQYPEMSGIDPNELTELRTLGEIVTFVSGKGGATVATNSAAPVQQTVNTVAAAPMTPTNNGVSSSNGTDNSALTRILLEVVSEKTGYPAEMLELNMDMEADLGIDSIKRVEIFGALTAQYPEMSGIDPNELTELRTLGEIVTFVSGKGGASVATNNAAPVQQVTNTVVTAPSSNNGNGSADLVALQAALLEVVSEKTGYPAEMLELNMDMEADLGIDSIKRVEIFGALTTQYPDMSGIDPNELTELRTLGEIVTFVGAKVKKKSPVM